MFWNRAMVCGGKEGHRWAGRGGTWSRRRDALELGVRAEYPCDDFMLQGGDGESCLLPLRVSHQAGFDQTPLGRDEHPPVW